MSQTKRKIKKLAKNHARRKLYEITRNRLRGRKKKPVKPEETALIDGAEWYRQLKEKEMADKKQKSVKGGLFSRLLKNFNRGEK